MKAQNYVKGDFGLATRKPLTRAHRVWVAIAFVVPLVLGTWATTQWFAWTFSYAPTLGPTLDGRHLYPPWQILSWLHTMRGETLVELGKARGFLALSGVAGVLGMLLALGTIMRDLKNRAGEAHDSGRWGREDELREHGLLVNGYPQDGIVLGTYQPDPNRRARQGAFVQRVVDNTDTPVAIVGPPGAGKNTVIGFPTLHTWRDSAVVIDPKLESYLFTSGFRARKLNQWVGILDFVETTRELSHDGKTIHVDSLHYNFLDFIRLGTDFEVRDAGTTALYFTDSSGRGTEDPRNEHWVVTPAGLLAAACLHVMYRARRENWGRNATMFDVAWELSGRDHPAVEAAIQNAVQQLTEAKKPIPADPATLVDATAEVIRSWLNYEHASSDAEGWERPNGSRSRTHLFIAMRAQEQLDRMTTPEGSGHVSTVRKVLTLFEDPHTRRVTSRSDFRVEDLQALHVDSPSGPKDGVTLYIPFPLDGPRLKPLYRAFLCQATSRLTETQKHKSQRKRLLFFLDEFPALGRLDVLFNIFAIGRGYGIKPVVLFQTFAQLEERWGAAAARALIDTAETLVAMAPGPGAIETAERLSKMTGRVTVLADNRSRSAQGGRTNVSDSQREMSRPLLTAVEVMSLPRTIHKRTADGKDVLRPDGTVVMASLGQQLMFRKNLPVVRLLQSPHYADPLYLKLTRMRPALLPKTPNPPPRGLAPHPAPVPARTPAPAALYVPLTARAQAWGPPPRELLLAQPSPEPVPEDTDELLTLLEAALQAHDLPLQLGPANLGPHLVMFDIAGTDELVLALSALVPELSAAIGRSLWVHQWPQPHVAVARLRPALALPSEMPHQNTPVVVLGLDADGEQVDIDLRCTELELPSAAVEHLSRWLAPLVAMNTPAELALELPRSLATSCNWPHVRQEPLAPTNPSGLRVEVCEVCCSDNAPALVIRAASAAAAVAPTKRARLLIDGALPPHDFWVELDNQPRRRLHASAFTQAQLDSLAAHWAARPACAPNATIADELEEQLLDDDGVVNARALARELLDDLDIG